MEELSVIGLDLVTGREVTIVDEYDVPFWRGRGWRGNRTLVCLHCYTGAEDGRRRSIPLVARGRVAGMRRAHFAHPPGMSPLGGQHHPETVWHAHGKQHLAAWARRQPDVVDAAVEAWTPDGRRRSDVQVTFTDGRVTALELQNGPITDAEWIDRHQDYQHNDIADTWLWHPRTGVPGIVAHHGEPGWIYPDDPDLLRAVVGMSHPKPDRWWTHDDTDVYGTHWPPHSGDDTRLLDIPLAQVVLSSTGLQLTTTVTALWRTRTLADADHAAAVPAQPPVQPKPRTPARTSWHTELPAHRGLVRIDAQPPGRDDPARRRHLCTRCKVSVGAPDVDQHRDCEHS